MEVIFGLIVFVLIVGLVARRRGGAPEPPPAHLEGSSSHVVYTETYRHPYT